LDKALVSVIIPAFNAAAEIRQTLNSVLAQTYQAIEVIVVDDGSSDATAAIVEEFVTRDVRIQLAHLRRSRACPIPLTSQNGNQYPARKLERRWVYHSMPG
jgi:glycosyltransferase involved in cell wall biosynthesis